MPLDCAVDDPSYRKLLLSVVELVRKNGDASRISEFVTDRSHKRCRAGLQVHVTLLQVEMVSENMIGVAIAPVRRKSLPVICFLTRSYGY